MKATLKTATADDMCPLTQARQHIEAARQLGRIIAESIAHQAASLAEAATAAAEIESVPVGAREEARKLGEFAAQTAQRIEALLGRA
jgi:hypothetical protein